MDGVKRIIENLDPEHVAIVVKAIPIILPDALDHHTPKLEKFIKPGTLQISTVGLLCYRYFLQYNLLEKSVVNDIFNPML